VETQHRLAKHRSRFEQILFRLKTHVAGLQKAAPTCFISYAWGKLEHEQWVEQNLANDLLKAGIVVLLDRWESGISSHVPRFVERIITSQHVVVVGTPAYRQKYDNAEAMGGFVVAAEGDLIGARMMGTEEQKQRVSPVLLEGTPASSFPALLQSRGYANFTDSERYFETALALALHIHEIKLRNPVAIELRNSLGSSAG